MITHSQKEEETFNIYLDDWINYQNTPRHQEITKHIIKLIKIYNKHNFKILELGCGITPFPKYLNKANYTGLDISQKLLNLNTQQSSNNVKFFKGDALKIDNYFNEKFDVIFMTGLLHHINRKDHIKLLTHIYKILKKQGHIILIEPNMISLSGVYCQLRLIATKYIPQPILRKFIGFYSEEEKFIFPNKLLNQMSNVGFKVNKKYSIMPLRLPPLFLLNKINIQPINRILNKITKNYIYGGTTVIVKGQKI